MLKLLSLVITFSFLVSCGESESDYNKKNREDTVGVDYSIPMNLKRLMKVDNGLDSNIQLYYTLNNKSDTISQNEVEKILLLADTVVKNYHLNDYRGAYLVIMKETSYTNRLRESPGISDSYNPFPYNNVYYIELSYNYGVLNHIKVNAKN